MTASYVALVRLAPARRLIYALAVGGLSYGMVALTILLTVQRPTGSYVDGGFADAAFALAAGVSAPIRGRLVDRRGRAWLPALAFGYAACLIALDLAAHGDQPTWLLVAIAGLTGLTAAPLFASARVVWAQAVPPALIRRGYAVTALLYDAGQVAGPALASLIFLGSSWVGAFVVGATGVAGAILSLPTRHPDHFDHAPKPMPRLRESRSLLGILAISIVLGGAGGIIQVGVPVAASRWHETALAGGLLAAFAVGSVLGGLWYGGRLWLAPVIDRYLLSVLAFGLLLAPVVLAGDALALAPLLLFAGLAFGPATVSLFETLDVVAPGSGAESLTWITTAEAGGAAGGSALAGVLASHTGATVPFALGSSVLVASSGLALLVRRSRR
ncbi:MAG TPA: MFS transporter [Gaiellaceae bacterium]|jgi:predicted MFS family arabinose efflux permease